MAQSAVATACSIFSGVSSAQRSHSSRGRCQSMFVSLEKRISERKSWAEIVRELD